MEGLLSIFGRRFPNSVKKVILYLDLDSIRILDGSITLQANITE